MFIDIGRVEYATLSILQLMLNTSFAKHRIHRDT